MIQGKPKGKKMFLVSLAVTLIGAALQALLARIADAQRLVRGQRRQGSTKYTLRRMVELAVSGIAAHSVRPLRFAIWLALGFAALGVLLVVYSVISFLFVHRTVAGWTSIMAALALLGAAQLFVLGIIGEYVGRVLRETRKRPSYIVAETEADRRVPQRVEYLGAAE